jgi:hypothetical protein
MEYLAALLAPIILDLTGTLDGNGSGLQIEGVFYAYKLPKTH